MPKKIKKEELKNVSGGGNDGKEMLTCKSPSCGKKFYGQQLVKKGNNLCCPYCGTVYTTYTD